MFLEYLTDMSFVIATVVGGIIAILVVFVRRKRRTQ